MENIFAVILKCMLNIVWRRKHRVKRNPNPIPPQKGKNIFKVECRATWTSDKSEGRIRWDGGESILCWPITPTVSLKLKLDIRENPSSKLVRKWQFNEAYETNHSTYGQVIICNGKQVHFSDSKICEMMTWKVIHYNPTISIFCQ
jgi:hypothetical protein